MHKFQDINIDSIAINVFQKIGQEWMLITAGDKEKANTMTASWGAAGVLWNKNVAIIFVRKSRYTNEFIDKNDTFSLTFFDDSFKKELKYLGAVSGRDEDKMENVMFHFNYENATGTPFVDEGKEVLVCKKLAKLSFTEGSVFLDDESIKEFYKTGDYHDIYVGEIIQVFAR